METQRFINDTIKKDFGPVFLKKRTCIYEQIRAYMKENGYNVKYCDVCSVEIESFNEKDIVRFKFVHYTTPTMNTEPYYKIEFIYNS